MNIVNYLTHKRNTPLPPITAVFYEYITAANGVFIRAENDGFHVQIPVVHHRQGQPIMGLGEFAQEISWKIPKPPITLLHKMLQDARNRTGFDGNLIEHLYHLRWNLSEEKYEIHQPAQWAGKTFANSENTETPDGYITIADIHSHGNMDAYFSDQDNPR